MRKLLFIFFFYLGSVVVYSQASDQLQAVFNSVQNEEINKNIANQAMAIPYDKITNNLKVSLFIFERLYNAGIYKDSLLALGDMQGKLALLYYMKGDYLKSSEFRQKSILIFDKIGDRQRKAIAMASLAYESKKRNLKQSLETMSLAYHELKQLNDNIDLTAVADNYGVLFEMNDNLDSALKYYNEALQLKTEIRDSVGIPYSLNNIAGIYFMNGNIREGLKYIDRSSLIRNKLKDYIGLAWNEFSLGELYFNSKDLLAAKKHFYRSAKLCDQTSYLELKSRNLKYLAEIYSEQGKIDSAFIYFKLFYALNDSLFNSKTQDQLIEMETIYESERKNSRIKTLDNENKLKESEIERKRTTQNYLTILIFAAFVAAGLAFYAYRLKKRDNRIISEQKNLVELKSKELAEKHKEITDSINYAERIQRSFLATRETLNKNLNTRASLSACLPARQAGVGGAGLDFARPDNYFIFFKPKDVVSGDFYWAATLNNGNFAFVTADSTGHGVPGAIMSLLNITSLEKAIEETSDPAEILNRTRQTIIERLKKDGSPEGGKDGMDCSIIVFNKDKTKLEVAAAHNPVWIFRKTQDAEPVEVSNMTNSMTSTGSVPEIIEIKPDKMPVGKHDRDKEPFTKHIIDIQPGDVIYTLTDGFPDQFGGPSGKKFKIKKLKELLAGIAHLPLEKQHDILSTTLRDWVGKLEQIDDITLVGIKV